MLLLYREVYCEFEPYSSLTSWKLGVDLSQEWKMILQSGLFCSQFFLMLNPLSANPTKRPNTLKQFVAKLPTNFLSVFGHFVNLALKGLKFIFFFFHFLLPVFPLIKS